jgi:RNA polymerase sigma-70 factor (ECF subfamily)
MMPFVPWKTTDRAAIDTGALLRRLAEGDGQALGEIYRREAGPVYRYALALCGNAAWAADATQEAFVVLATKAQGYDVSRGALGAYLAGVARHALAALWREGRLEVPLPEDDEALAPQEAAASPETLLVQAQDGSLLWAALRRLPTPFREALVLVDLQERPYADAARIAGIEINTLRTRLHRARLKLAALLGADGGSAT